MTPSVNEAFLVPVQGQVDDPQAPGLPRDPLRELLQPHWPQSNALLLHGQPHPTQTLLSVLQRSKCQDTYHLVDYAPRVLWDVLTHVNFTWNVLTGLEKCRVISNKLNMLTKALVCWDDA